MDKVHVRVYIVPCKISDAELAHTSSMVVVKPCGCEDNSSPTETVDNTRIYGEALRPILKFEVSPDDFFFGGRKIHNSSFGISSPYVERILLSNPLFSGNEDICHEPNRADNYKNLEVRIEGFRYGDNSELIGIENYKYARRPDDEEYFGGLIRKIKKLCEPW